MVSVFFLKIAFLFCINMKAASGVGADYARHCKHT